MSKVFVYIDGSTSVVRQPIYLVCKEVLRVYEYQVRACWALSLALALLLLSRVDKKVPTTFLGILHSASFNSHVGTSLPSSGFPGHDRRRQKGSSNISRHTPFSQFQSLCGYVTTFVCLPWPRPCRWVHCCVGKLLQSDL